MQNLLLEIADVKCFMTFGNINKPLKVLVHLDSLTCCPEVELSLTEEAFYGLSGGGGGEHCPPLCLACFIQYFSESSGGGGRPILELQRCFYAPENEQERAG